MTSRFCMEVNLDNTYNMLMMMMTLIMMMMFKVPLDVSASGLHILHSNGSLEVWPGEAGDHVYQCRVTLGEVGSLLSTPATLRSPGEKIVLDCETGKI